MKILIKIGRWIARHLPWMTEEEFEMLRAVMRDR